MLTKLALQQEHTEIKAILDRIKETTLELDRLVQQLREDWLLEEAVHLGGLQANINSALTRYQELREHAAKRPGRGSDATS